MQSRHIKAVIGVGLISSLVSLAASLAIWMSPELNLQSRPALVRDEALLGAVKPKSAPALAYQELALAQKAPLFRFDRLPFVPHQAPQPVPQPTALVLQAVQSAPAATLPIAMVEATQFTLKGVLIEHAAKRALLVSSEKPQGEWHVIGDQLSGWTIDAIDFQKITLKRDERTADLFLYVDNQDKAVGTP